MEKRCAQPVSDLSVMANDRIRIRCLVCQENAMLFKFYPYGGILDGGCTNSTQELDAFFSKHLEHCHPHGYDVCLRGNPGFDLFTDSPQERIKAHSL